MFILLPPSESKRVTIQGSAFNASNPELFLSDNLSVSRARAEAWSAYQRIIADPELAISRLKLGKNFAAEYRRLISPESLTAIPAGNRYEGTLYKALGEGFLNTYSVSRARPQPLRILVQSALFGLIDLADLIPYYRLSHNSSVLQSSRVHESLRSLWSGAYLDEPPFPAGARIIDLRSNGYRELFPLEQYEESFVVSVVDASGERSLNHFNKRYKGEFVAAVAALWGDDSISSDFSDLVRSAAEKAKLGVEIQGNQIRLRVLG